MKKKIFWLLRLISAVLIICSITTITSYASDHLRTPINYKKSSETVAYPSDKVTHSKKFWIHVDISASRVYLMKGKQKVYIMYCSAGKIVKKHGQKVSYTPTGTFHIQEEHGDTFYNASAKSGGNYYRSFHDHGKFLFHTVPIDAKGHYIKSEAAKLGKEPASHGCVRLSIPDAQWFYSHVPVGTKVVVEK